MKKYSDLYKTKKRWYEEALQRYQQGNPDEVDIINIRKRCYKAEAKVGSKAGIKQVQRPAQRRVQSLPGASTIFLWGRSFVR